MLDGREQTSNRGARALTIALGLGVCSGMADRESSGHWTEALARCDRIARAGQMNIYHHDGYSSSSSFGLSSLSHFFGFIIGKEPGARRISLDGLLTFFRHLPLPTRKDLDGSYESSTIGFA